jgi:hypothetical protein
MANLDLSNNQILGREGKNDVGVTAIQAAR